MPSYLADIYRRYRNFGLRRIFKRSGNEVAHWNDAEIQTKAEDINQPAMTPEKVVVIIDLNDLVELCQMRPELVP